MIILVSVCAVTERGRWRTWQRIALVPAAWIAQALLNVPAVLVVGMPVWAWRPEIADRVTSLAASVPVVIFTMRQSRLFVAPAQIVESERGSVASA